MRQLTHRQYDAIEGAIIHGRRLSVYRRGTEYVVVPKRLRMDGSREAIDSIHPTTGEEITIYLDEMDNVEVVG
ncbi:MAG TPA: hypothetical protein VM099_13100 [Gemmatimonadaceae bacterium]|nr:hypothetical protein [Gemmatimonadaceae bacterium]